MALRTIANSRLIDGEKLDNLPADVNSSLATKQDTLVSGTNIKTINGVTLLGSGDMTVNATPTTDAGDLVSGTLDDARLSSNVTIQGNTFNGASQLVQLDGTGKLPAVDGSQLTGLAGGGDMVASVYDPTNIAGDSFDRSNHTGTQTASTISDIDTYTGTLTNKTLDDYTNFIHADGTHLRVKALENLTKGDVIMFVGFNSGESAIEVQKHNSSTAPAIGIMYSAITTGSFGMAISNGYLRDINTIAYPEGTILYPNTTGGFTTTPTINGTNYNQPIAYVLRSHAVNGIIMINIGPGHDLAPYVGYDNTTSGLVATNVQDAIDEITAGTISSDPDFYLGNSAFYSVYSDRNDLFGLKSSTSVFLSKSAANINTATYNGTAYQSFNMVTLDATITNVNTMILGGYLYVSTWNSGSVAAIYRCATTSDISVAGNWQTITISGTTLTTLTYFSGYLNNNIYMTIGTDTFLKFTLSGTTFTYTGSLTITGSVLGGSSPVNNNGLYCHFSSGAAYRKYSEAGVDLLEYNGNGLLFCTPNSVYGRVNDSDGVISWGYIGYVKM